MFFFVVMGAWLLACSHFSAKKSSPVSNWLYFSINTNTIVWVFSNTIMQLADIIFLMSPRLIWSVSTVHFTLYISPTTWIFWIHGSLRPLCLKDLLLCWNAWPFFKATDTYLNIWYTCWLTPFSTPFLPPPRFSYYKFDWLLCTKFTSWLIHSNLYTVATQAPKIIIFPSCNTQIYGQCHQFSSCIYFAMTLFVQ